MNKIVLFVCALVHGATFAQPAISWQKSLGGSANDNGFSVQQTIDGGYIIAGETGSTDGQVTGNHGGYDAWVVKLDALGNIEWQKALGGSGHDSATCVRQTFDGGYILAGSSNSNDGQVSGNHGVNDYWVVKLDTDGQIVWQKSLGGSRGEWAYDIQQTLDSGFIVAGVTESDDGDVTGQHGIAGDCWIVKLDNSGTLQWQKALGGSANDVARSIRPTADDGYIFSGRTRSNDGDVSGNHGDEDLWVVKLENSGNIEWQKCLGGTNFDAGYGIVPTDDGGYLTTGLTYSSNGDVTNPRGFGDIWAVKLDQTGAIQWQKCYGGVSADAANTVFAAGNNSFIIAGYSYSDDGNVMENKGNADWWILKIDSAGDIVWQKTYGGTGTEFAMCVEQSGDGGLVAAGHSNSNDYDVSGNHGAHDFWVIKLEPELSVHGFDKADIALYPNPARDRIYIASAQTFTHYAMYDAMGKCVQTGKPGVSVAVDTLVPGWYLVQLSNGQTTTVHKFLKQ